MGQFVRNGAFLILSLLAGSVVAYAIGSVCQSVMLLLELSGVGAEFDAATWARVVWHDFVRLAFGGKYISYGANLLVAFFVAMPCAVLIARIIHFPLKLVATVAGAVAIFTMISIVNWNSPSPIFSGVRGETGMSLQLIAGGLGGFIFTMIYNSLRVGA